MGQPVDRLFLHAIRLGRCELLVQFIQLLGNDVLLLVGTQDLVAEALPDRREGGPARIHQLVPQRVGVQDERTIPQSFRPRLDGEIHLMEAQKAIIGQEDRLAAVWQSE